MTDLERLDCYLKHKGIVYFSAKEICTLRKISKVVVPPEAWWPRIIPTLQLADELRVHLGFPLFVGNGYRPADYNKAVKGSKTSQHIFFRALDLDLPKKMRSVENQETLYEETCKLFLERGVNLKMGMGLYRPWRGTRVHIDTGHKRRYWKAKYVKPLLNSLR